MANLAARIYSAFFLLKCRRTYSGLSKLPVTIGSGGKHHHGRRAVYWQICKARGLRKVVADIIPSTIGRTVAAKSNLCMSEGGIGGRRLRFQCCRARIDFLRNSRGRYLLAMYRND